MTQQAKAFMAILFAILKGGAAKSTSAMMVAFALARRGVRVLVIDADSGTQGVTDWATSVYAEEGGELPFDVFQWSPREGLLVPFVRDAQRKTGAQLVLVDIGGEAPEVLMQAAKLADLAVVPLGPTQPEVSRLEPTLTKLQQAGLRAVVLLNRVSSPGLGAAKALRDTIVGDGNRVMATEIKQSRELYADPWGGLPSHVAAYEQVADELVTELGIEHLVTKVDT